MTIGTHDIIRRCRAHNRAGDQCRQHAIRGGTVCVTHGGAAPQVKKSAKERLDEMVDPMLTELFRIALSGEAEAVRLAAVKDALDRAGYKPVERVQEEQSGELTIRYVNDWRAPDSGVARGVPSTLVASPSVETIPS